MAVIETKYSIGDVVWRAGTVTETKSHPCPDCLGSHKWDARSPAGGLFEVGCPRCTANYMANDALNLKYQQWAPTAQRLTIGQVTAQDGGDRARKYMAHETGVGSGSVYSENELFETEAEALAAAQIKANVANLDQAGWVAKQYDKTASFSDYQLKDALIEAAQRSARSAINAAGYLIEDIETAYNIEEVKQRIQAWRDRDCGPAPKAEAEVAS